MARFQLTEVMIRSSFEKTGVNEKFYPIYNKISKRYFEDLSNEGSDQDVQTEDDNYAVSSLNLADEYISDYVREAERGHCEQWCDIVADESDDDYKRYCIAYNSIENEEGREKELRIHANSLSEDPIFVERYIYLFKVLDNNPPIRAKEYATAYHKCIEDGRNQNYAHGYAYAVSECHYLEQFCQIFAEAYEAAKEQGKIDAEAISFGEFCSDALDQGVYYSLNKYLERYHEDWHVEFYYKQICNEEELDKSRTLTEKEKNEIRKDIRWRLSQMEKKIVIK